ncbi:hypothetical protein [Stutzerimonas balearica]|uniref:hypothetical protein n=1 Tax=Stutzerimonas balearica TaxID=74829 RepID=UPI002897FA73|nr:hypothetical protein [Stutzerimonas balearica]
MQRFELLVCNLQLPFQINQLGAGFVVCLLEALGVFTFLRQFRLQLADRLALFLKIGLGQLKSLLIVLYICFKAADFRLCCFMLSDGQVKLFGGLLQLYLKGCITILGLLLLVAQPRFVVEGCLEFGLQRTFCDLQFLSACICSPELLTQRGAVSHSRGLRLLRLLKLYGQPAELPALTQGRNNIAEYQTG